MATKTKLAVIGLLVICFFQIPSVAGNKCYKCGDDGICTKREQGTLTECPTPPPGLVNGNQCVKVDGDLKLWSGDMVVGNFTGLLRTCFVHTPDTKSAANGCYHDAKAVSYMRQLYPIDGKVTFSGVMCFCAEDGCNGGNTDSPFN